MFGWRDYIIWIQGKTAGPLSPQLFEGQPISGWPDRDHHGGMICIKTSLSPLVTTRPRIAQIVTDF
jgi:hypothetical protein